MEIDFHEEELKLLQKLGFPVNPLNKKVNSLKEAWQESEDLNHQKDNLAYPIDGLVIKLNDNRIVKKLGTIGKTNRAWAAIKFPAQEVSTKILDISWQVGRTGKLTPVADLEPVLLAGTTVKRATLHNLKNLKDLNLHFHDHIIIRKAGEIIPEVVQVLVNLRSSKAKLINFPNVCPSCGTKLKLSNTKVDLICSNMETCPAQVLGRLSYFAQRNVANIEGLSAKNIQKFIQKFGISEIADLYNLDYEEIAKMEGFGKKSVENLQKSINKSRKLEAVRFLAGLGIEGLGLEGSELVIKKIMED